MRVIAARQPCGATALLPAVAAPGPVAKLSRSRDGIEPPKPLSGCCVVGVDKAANPELSSRDADNNLVFDRQGCSSQRVALERISHLGFPEQASGPRIQSDQRRVQRPE